MAGSLANPVLLDPFQAITEVGWSGLPTHIAFLIDLGNSNSSGQDVICAGTVPEPEPPYRATYVTQSQIEYDSPSSGAVTSIRLRRKDTWGGLITPVSVGAEVSALPSLPTFNFGYFQHVGVSGGTSGFTVSSPALRWTPPTGAELDIPLPLSNDKFLDVLTASLFMFSDTFIGSPSCIDGFGSQKYAQCTGSKVGVEDSYDNAIDIGANHEFSMASMTATYPKGNGVVSFRARGLRLTGGTDKNGGKGGSADLWVLLEREGLSSS